MFFFTTFIVGCCICLFLFNQTYCVGMVSVTSASCYQRDKKVKVDPLCTTEVDSTELANVRADSNSPVL